MRRIVMFARVTPDGYLGAAGGNLDWMKADDELDKAVMGSQRVVDTFIFGRKTYEMMAGYWPQAIDDSKTAADPHDTRRRTAETRAMGVALNENPKLVFSTTLKEATWKNTQLLRKFDPAEIEALKRKPGADMLVLGSGSIVSQLTQHGLLDEYQIVVSPILLGSGIPLLSNVTRRVPLELLEAKAFKSGNVLLRYAPGK
jgi:dihydrofolate reductase